jgi:RNA polymerase sigma factor (sigma-70 family)
LWNNQELLNSGETWYAEDQEIFSDLKSGQLKAFDQLYKLYRSDFLKAASFKFKMVPKEDIIDAWQDTVISFYEQVNAGKLTTLSCSLKSYLFILGYRYIIKYNRRHAREYSTDMIDEHRDIDTSEVELEWEATLNNENKIVEDAISQLPEQSKRMLVMRYLEGKSIEEIKIAMNYTSSKAVSVGVSRTVQRLREMIKLKQQSGNR